MFFCFCGGQKKKRREEGAGGLHGAVSGCPVYRGGRCRVARCARAVVYSCFRVFAVPFPFDSPRWQVVPRSSLLPLLSQTIISTLLHPYYTIYLTLYTTQQHNTTQPIQCLSTTSKDKTYVPRMYLFSLSTSPYTLLTPNRHKPILPPIGLYPSTQSISGVINQSMPMMAMFLRNKFIAWFSFLQSIHYLLNTSTEQLNLTKNKNNSPSALDQSPILRVIISLIALSVCYLNLIWPQPN